MCRGREEEEKRKRRGRERESVKRFERKRRKKYVLMQGKIHTHCLVCVCTCVCVCVCVCVCRVCVFVSGKRTQAVVLSSTSARAPSLVHQWRPYNAQSSPHLNTIRFVCDTHTHTHTHRERENERETKRREKGQTKRGLNRLSLFFSFAPFFCTLRSLYSIGVFCL